MSEAIVWFLALEGLGVIALPWTYAVFRFLPDRGLTLAKPLGLLVLAYIVWLLGLTHILPNTQLTIWIVFAGLGLGSARLASRHWEEIRDFIRTHWLALATGEVIFVLMFVAWALVVSGSPGISHTEKPMDFMLLNAAHQARYFPAEDSWLAGHSISYYYFGHIIMSTLAKDERRGHLRGLQTSPSPRCPPWPEPLPLAWFTTWCACPAEQLAGRWAPGRPLRRSFCSPATWPAPWSSSGCEDGPGAVSGTGWE